MRQIELPKKRQDCNMSTWHRVMAKDGSTIAYCPDIITAMEIAAVPDMLEACQNTFSWLANHFEEFSDETNMEALCLSNALETVIQKAKGES